MHTSAAFSTLFKTPVQTGFRSPTLITNPVQFFFSFYLPFYVSSFPLQTKTLKSQVIGLPNLSKGHLQSHNGRRRRPPLAQPREHPPPRPHQQHSPGKTNDVQASLSDINALFLRSSPAPASPGLSSTSPRSTSGSASTERLAPSESQTTHR